MENLRENYNILENEYFFVIGGHEGDISDRIINKFNPNVWIFEPNSYWYKFLLEKYKKNPKVKIFNFGFLKSPGQRKLYKFGSGGDGSNVYNESEEYEICEFKNLSDFISENDVYVKLIEFNCEGSEYEIIEEISSSGAIKKFENIQVQFHRLENYSDLYRGVSSILSQTHNKSWGFDFIWESWKIR